MDPEYPADFIDGRPVPPLVVRGDHVQTGVHCGSVIVDGGQRMVAGTLQGTLTIGAGGLARESGPAGA